MTRKLLPVLLLLALAACGEKVELPPPATRIVKVIAVSSSTDEQTRTFGGDIRARQETIIGFRIGGKMTQRLVDVGSIVNAGQVLARIDTRDLILQATEADAQSALAAADAKRYQDLRAKNFVSQAAVDTRDTAHKAASAQATIARNQAAYAVLAADHAGVVAEVLAQPGQVVAAGQGVFRLALDGEREVLIAIPEDALADVHVGNDAEVNLWTTDKKYPGRIREIAPIADPATRTYSVRVSIMTKETLPLGMSATVSFKKAGASLMLIPITSVFQDGSDPAVWVVGKDNKVMLRKVQVASYGDQGTRVSAGLADGERIVTAGVHRLHAGEIVSIADSSR